MIESVQQNTPEWLEMRRRYLGASDSPILAGFAKYKDIWYLWRDKLGLNPPEKQSYPAQRGHDLEPVAIDIFNFEFGVHAEPRQMISQKVPFMSASLDGYLEESNSIVEVKCPMGKRAIEDASQGLVKPEHYPQLQHQLFVSGAQYVDYVTFDGESTIYVKRVWPDLKYQRNLVRLAKWFWHKVETKTEIIRYGVELGSDRS